MIDPRASELTDLPDEALVLLAQRQDRLAFEQLVRRTARLVFAHLYLQTGSAQQAEELVQETFLSAWRSLDQVKRAAGFRAWLLAVAHSTAVDAARRRWRQKRGGLPQDADALLTLPHPGPSPPELAQRNEQRRRVIDAMRTLPDEQRQVLTLRYLAGADYAQIGRQMGISNGSLRGLLNRGLAMLREILKSDL